MSEYTINHRPRRLREDDKVTFEVGRNGYTYVVLSECLFNWGGANDVIFREMEADKRAMAEKAYGYSPTDEARPEDYTWPESKPRDFSALCRLVNALYDLIDTRQASLKQQAASEPEGSKPPALVSLGFDYFSEMPGVGLTFSQEIFETREGATQAGQDFCDGDFFVAEIFAGSIKRVTTKLIEEDV